MSTIVALHGFFGHPTDWQGLFDEATKFTPNLFEDLPIQPYDRWAKEFQTYVNKKVPDITSKTLVGYSLGGRLALHALIANPEAWNCAVIISTNPGLSDATEKSKRMPADALWAEKIRTMPWDALMNAWNSMEVFQKDTIVPSRNERDYQREKLAEAMTTWSLGAQEDLRLAISSLKMPILWIVGEHEQKFREQAFSLRFSHPESRVLTIKDAGHRVPWYNQQKLTETIYQFIKREKNDDDN